MYAHHLSETSNIQSILVKLSRLCISLIEICECCNSIPLFKSLQNTSTICFSPVILLRITSRQSCLINEESRECHTLSLFVVILEIGFSQVICVPLILF